MFNFRTSIKSAYVGENKRPAFIIHTIIFSIAIIVAIGFIGYGYINLQSRDTTWYIGGWIVALLPAYFLYLSSHNPFNWRDGSALFLKIISVIMIVATIIGEIYFITCYGDEYLVHIDVTLAGILFVWGICMQICYLIAYLYICKDKASGAYIFVVLVSPILPFMLIGLFQFLALKVFFKVFGFLGEIFPGNYDSSSSDSSSNEKFTVYENGYERTLEYDTYYLGKNRYKDDVGNYWVSDDGGRTVHRE